MPTLPFVTTRTAKTTTKKRGRGRPKIPGKTTISVRMSEETLTRVKRAAEQYGNLSVWIEDAALQKLRSLDLLTATQRDPNE